MGLIASCFSNILYLSEKVVLMGTCAGLIACIVLMFVVSLGMGIGLGYNYCFVDLKTRHIKVPGHYSDKNVSRPGDIITTPKTSPGYTFAKNVTGNDTAGNDTEHDYGSYYHYGYGGQNYIQYEQPGQPAYHYGGGKQACDCWDQGCPCFQQNTNQGQQGEPGSQGPPGGPDVQGPPGGPDLQGPPGGPDIQGPPGYPDLQGRPGYPDLQGRPGYPDLQGPPDRPVGPGGPEGGPGGPEGGPLYEAPDRFGPMLDQRSDQYGPVYPYGPRQDLQGYAYGLDRVDRDRQTDLYGSGRGIPGDSYGLQRDLYGPGQGPQYDQFGGYQHSRGNYRQGQNYKVSSASQQNFNQTNKGAQGTSLGTIPIQDKENIQELTLLSTSWQQGQIQYSTMSPALTVVSTPWLKTNHDDQGLLQYDTGSQETVLKTITDQIDNNGPSFPKSDLFSPEEGLRGIFGPRLRQRRAQPGHFGQFIKPGENLPSEYKPRGIFKQYGRGERFGVTPFDHVTSKNYDEYGGWDDFNEYGADARESNKFGQRLKQSGQLKTV